MLIPNEFVGCLCSFPCPCRQATSRLGEVTESHLIRQTDTRPCLNDLRYAVTVEHRSCVHLTWSWLGCPRSYSCSSSSLGMVRGLKLPSWFIHKLPLLSCCKAQAPIWLYVPPARVCRVAVSRPVCLHQAFSARPIRALVLTMLLVLQLREACLCSLCEAAHTVCTLL